MQNYIVFQSLFAFTHPNLMNKLEHLEFYVVSMSKVACNWRMLVRCSIIIQLHATNKCMTSVLNPYNTFSHKVSILSLVNSEVKTANHVTMITSSLYA